MQKKLEVFILNETFNYLMKFYTSIYLYHRYKLTVYKISGDFAAFSAVSILKRKASFLSTLPPIKVEYIKVLPCCVLQ